MVLIGAAACGGGDDDDGSAGDDSAGEEAAADDESASTTDSVAATVTTAAPTTSTMTTTTVDDSTTTVADDSTTTTVASGGPTTTSAAVETSAPTTAAPPTTVDPTPPDVDDLTHAVVQRTLANARDFGGDYCRPFGGGPLDPVGDTSRWPLFMSYNGPGDGGDFVDVCFIGAVEAWPVDVVVRDPSGEVAGSVRVWRSDEPVPNFFYEDAVLLIGETDGGTRYSGVYVATPGAEHAEIPMLLPHDRRVGAWTVEWSDATTTQSSATEIGHSCPAEPGGVSDVFGFPSSAWQTEFPDPASTIDHCIFVPDLVGADVASAVTDFRLGTALLLPFGAVSSEPSIDAVADCVAAVEGPISAQNLTPNTSLRFVSGVLVEYPGPCPAVPDVVGQTVTQAASALEALTGTHPFFSWDFRNCFEDTSVVAFQSASAGTQAGRVRLDC